MLNRFILPLSGLFWLFCGVMFLSSGAEAANYTWVGNRSTDWNNSNNWSPAKVPGAGDTVVIGAGKRVTTSQKETITLAGATIGRGATVDSEASLTINGPFDLNGATWRGDGDMVVNGQLTMSAARWDGEGDVTTNGISTAINSTISGKSEFMVNKDFTATDCVFDSGKQFIGAKAVFSLLSKGGIGNVINSDIENSGVVIWGSGDLVVNRAFKNRDGATIDLQSDGTLSGDKTTSLFDNAGKIKKSRNSGKSTIEVPYNNVGSMDIDAGTLEFNDSFTQTTGDCNLNGGHIIARKGMKINGGRLDGTGDISGDVLNQGGSVKPGHSPGSITINGNYTQTANGSLDLEIGGLDAGISYDKLIVRGVATLNGTLNLIQYNGFVPHAGDSFELLEYYSNSGNFSAIRLQFPNGNVSFQTAKTPIYFLATALNSDNPNPNPTPSPTATPTPTPDTNGPEITITSPVDEAGYKIPIEASGTTGDISGVALVTAQLYRYANGKTAAGYWDGSKTWNPVYNAASHERPVAGTTQWKMALPALSEGQYYLRLTAKDSLGNVSTQTHNFWFDKTAPKSIAFSNPLKSAKVKSLDSVSGTATDSAGIERVDLSIKRVSDGKYWSQMGWVSSPATVSTEVSASTWTRNASALTPLPTGSDLPTSSYILTATIYDRAGSSKSASITVSVDSSAPVVTVTAPTNNSTYTTVTTATGKAIDTGSGVAKVKVALYRYATATTPAGYWVSGTVWSPTYNPATDRAASGTASWKLKLPKLNNGAYYLQATATDKSGNSGTSSGVYFVKSAGASAISVTTSAFSDSQNIQLNFSGALDATVAKNVARYSANLVSNGEALTIQSVSYNAANNSVTLTLSAPIAVGSQVNIKYSDLFDTTGKVLSGQTTTAANSSPTISVNRS